MIIQFQIVSTRVFEKNDLYSLLFRNYSVPQIQIWSNDCIVQTLFCIQVFKLMYCFIYCIVYIPTDILFTYFISYWSMLRSPTIRYGFISFFFLLLIFAFNTLNLYIKCQNYYISWWFKPFVIIKYPSCFLIMIFVLSLPMAVYVSVESRGWPYLWLTIFCIHMF